MPVLGVRIEIVFPQLPLLLAALDRWTQQASAPFQWAIGPVTQKARLPMPVEVTLTSEQQVRVTAHPTTAGGNPAQVDGPIQFTVQEGDCTVAPLDDTSAMIVSGAALADSVILVQADADLGAGIETIMDTVLVHVQHANASSVGLEVGTPELKP